MNEERQLLFLWAYFFRVFFFLSICFCIFYLYFFEQAVRRAAHALQVYEERQLVARRARKPTKTGGGSALAAFTGPTPTHRKKNGSAQPLRMPTATQLKAQGMEQVGALVA